MRWAATALWLVGACYSPTPGSGAPCTDDRQCPSPLRCVANTCGGTPADGSVDDRDATDAAESDGPLGAWSPSRPVEGVNTTSTESDPSFSQDRLTIAFSSDRTGDDDIYLGTRMAPSGPFTVTRLDLVSAVGVEDQSPELSADGQTLYFTSTRLGNFDVFRTTRANGGWQLPQRVEGLSSASTEGEVAISPDGRYAIVVRGSKFYGSTRANVTDPWPSPTEIVGAFGTNPAGPALNAALDLYHHASDTGRDLFVARRSPTGLDPSSKLVELDTADREAAPFVSPDDRHLMFECAGDICESSR